MGDYSVEQLRLRKNLTLVYMRSSYHNGIFKITETEYPVEKVNRANLRYNEVYDYRISHLNTVMPDSLAYGCYHVYVLKCDDDNSDITKYKHKLASSTAIDLKIRVNSVQKDLDATVDYLQQDEFENM